MTYLAAENRYDSIPYRCVGRSGLGWTLRDPRVTSALIGASRPEQIIENVGALQSLSFTVEELAEINHFAKEGRINLWERPSTAE